MVEGDGKDGAAIAAVSGNGMPIVFFADGGKIWKVSADRVGVGKEGWKDDDITK